MLRRGSLEVGLEPLDDLRPQQEGALPDTPKRSARLIADAAVGIERATEEIGQWTERRQPDKRCGELGCLDRDRAAVAPEATPSVEQRRQPGQLAGLGDGSGDTGALEKAAHVGNRFPGRCAGHGQSLTRLPGLAEAGADRVEVCRGLEGCRPLAAHRGTGVTGQEIPDPAPLRPPTGRD